ncbi:MAG: PTS sugar transporter subunit IIC [Deltaproteobacteria bacterium]|nr:PTS sugar transporter subunit IIC [Deltaproteobacteria bacterium]
MADIIWQSFLASVVGGLISLDRTAALQIMVSRPIVTAPVIGYMLGDAMTGLAIGGVLELLWIGELPIGGHIPPHEVIMTALITAVSLIGHKALMGTGIDIFPWKFGRADIIFIIGFTILIVIPMDMICKRIDAAARSLNGRFLNTALTDLNSGFSKSVEINNMKGLGIFFILNFTTIFVLIITGILLIYFLLPSLPAVVVMSLPLACGAAVILSLSSVYSAGYSSKSLPVFLATTFIVAAFLAVIIR